MSKSKRPVRVGVIGTGSIGKVHIEKLKAAGAEVAAACDIQPAVLAEAAERFAVPRTFADYRKLLSLDELDAVTVALPTCLHAPVSIAAARAGKHVLCEKPMAMNAGEARRMVAAAAKARKALQIGLTSRHGSESKLARELIAAGRIGQPYHVQAFAQRRRGVPGRGGWFTTKRRSGGGALLDIGVHMLDLACFLVGHPRPLAVSAQTYRKFIQRDDYACVGMWSSPTPGGPTDVEDYVTALVRLEGGRTIHLECCWAADVAEQRWQADVLGDRAGLLVKPGSTISIHGQEGGLLTDTTPVYRKNDAYLDEMQTFVASCRAGRATADSGEHGQYVQAIIDAIYRSAAAGREVPVRKSDLPRRW